VFGVFGFHVCLFNSETMGIPERSGPAHVHSMQSVQLSSEQKTGKTVLKFQKA
jgi:hypothetical protein